MGMCLSVQLYRCFGLFKLFFTIPPEPSFFRISKTGYQQQLRVCSELICFRQAKKFILHVQKKDQVHFLVKCCLQGLLKIIKLMIIVGQVRLSKGQLCPAGLGKRLGQGPAELEHPAGARNRTTPHPHVFSMILDPALPGSVPDPKF